MLIFLKENSFLEKETENTFKLMIMYCIPFEDIYDKIKNIFSGKNKRQSINLLNIIKNCLNEPQSISNLEKISNKFAMDLKLCIGDSDQTVRNISIEVFSKLYNLVG